MNEITGNSDSKQVVAAESAAVAKRALVPEGQDLVDLLNRGYICPKDAGPNWRAAFDAGVDMGLIEDSLLMQPEARLREHQRALNQVIGMTEGRPSHDSGS